MAVDVIGVGNALVDIQVRVDDAFLSDLALDKGIMTLVDDARQASVLSRLLGKSLHQCAGGSAANTIVGIAQFGGRAEYIGKIANDPIGNFFYADMRDLGIEFCVPQAAGGQTGTCAVLITPDAQRTMLTNLAVSATLCSSDIDPSRLRGAKYLYVEGYLLTGETTKQAAYDAMAVAKKAGVKVAFTASDPFLINMLREEIWALIEGPVDLFFCNEEEAKSLTGFDDPVACAAAIHKHAENVALTLGGKGSILMHGGETIPIEGVNCKAIDTTGAGDMYAGALLFGITSGMTWKQAGHLASHAAARVVTQLGARLEHRFSAAEVQSITAGQ